MTQQDIPPAGSKVILEALSWGATFTLKGTIKDTPWQEPNGEWCFNLRLYRNRRYDTFHLADIVSVKVGWE